MIISDIQINELQADWDYSAKITADTAKRGPFRTWFRYPQNIPKPHLLADPFLACYLIPCMYAGEDLHIDGPISKKLFDATDKIQEIIACWYQGLHPIKLTCSEFHQPIEHFKKPGKGCFFSGGIDSWYTLLKHKSEISQLILIRGFDIPAHDLQLWQETSQRAQAVADQMGKTFIPVRTNLKKTVDLTRKKCPWGKRYPGRFWRPAHGSGFASVILSLQHTLDRFYFPASVVWEQSYPFGSHPDLDPLWSTENTQIFHDGCEADRTEKIQQQLAHSPIALDNIRVCLSNKPGAYNCCRCEKCLRTMIALRIAGVLDQASTFPRVLDLKNIRRLYLLQDVLIYPIHQSIQRHAIEAGDKDLADALDIALGKKPWNPDHLIAKCRQFIGSTLIKIAPKPYDKKVLHLFGDVRKNPITETYPPHYVRPARDPS